MRKTTWRFAVALALLFSAMNLDAEGREILAARTPSPPSIDGIVDESVWSLAPGISGFSQCSGCSGWGQSFGVLNSTIGSPPRWLRTPRAGQAGERQDVQMT